MNLKHIKSDVYQFIAGDYLNVFLTEKELIHLIKDNDIAEVVKTPIGWFVHHDVGNIPFRHYLPIMSDGALELLSITLLNMDYEQQ
jgi:hypothetical protein